MTRPPYQYRDDHARRQAATLGPVAPTFAQDGAKAERWGFVLLGILLVLGWLALLGAVADKVVRPLADKFISPAVLHASRAEIAAAVGR
jgi:hypothetical protein